MAPLEARISVSGAKGSQMIGFAVGEACMMFMIITMYLFRARTLQLHRLTGRGLSFSRVLLNLIYLDGVSFILAVFVLTLDTGMRNNYFCEAAIQLCLVFYLGGKLLLYIFMCERLRAIRRALVDRCADILWQRCFWGVLVIFGQIAIICFYYDLESMERGWCAIGVPIFIAVPLLIFDVGCNLAVSAIFYKLSRGMFTGVMDALTPPEIKRYCYPRLVKVNGTTMFAISKPLSQMPQTDNATSMMAEIVRKTFLVSLFILFSTIANLILLVHYNGSEHGWMCFLMCSMDITWNISCLTYLIGLPTDHETPDEVGYTARERGFFLSTPDLHRDSSNRDNDANFFTGPYPDIAPPYRVQSTTAIWSPAAGQLGPSRADRVHSAAMWATATASASGFHGEPQTFEMQDFAYGGPGPVLRRDGPGTEWSFEEGH